MRRVATAQLQQKCAPLARSQRVKAEHLREAATLIRRGRPLKMRKHANCRPHLLLLVLSKLKPDEPISARALSRALRNNHVGEKHPRLFGCEPFTPHDLRRTAATHMTALGIERLHVGNVSNHSEGGDFTAVYDRHSYWHEKQRALATWETELSSIIDGKPSKVGLDDVVFLGVSVAVCLVPGSPSLCIRNTRISLYGLLRASSQDEHRAT